eukprot:2472220-Rhodomonas_salina.1
MGCRHPPCRTTTRRISARHCTARAQAGSSPCPLYWSIPSSSSLAYPPPPPCPGPSHQSLPLPPTLLPSRFPSPKTLSLLRFAHVTSLPSHTLLPSTLPHLGPPP